MCHCLPPSWVAVVTAMRPRFLSQIVSRAIRLWVARRWHNSSLLKMSSPQFQLIELHQNAPPKPRPGEPCNRCGVCCAAEPCPVAYVFLFQRKGRCRALVWEEESNGYSCGMVVHPDDFSRWIPKFSRRWLGDYFAQRIAAGQGCDSNIEIE